MKIFLYALFLLFPLALFARNQQPADTLYLKDISLEKINNEVEFGFASGMNGEYLWQFQDKDSSVFSSQDYIDTHWKKRPSSFTAQEIAAGAITQGAAWFRLYLVADSSNLAQPYVLTFKGTGIAEVYLDGQSICSFGNFSENAPEAYESLTARPAFFAVKTPGLHVLSVRYRNDEALKEKDTWGFSMSVSNPDTFIALMKNNQILISIFLIGTGTLFFTLFFVHFLLFLFYHKEISNLYFALFNLSISILLYLCYYVIHSNRDISYGYANVLILALGCIVVCFSMCAFTTTLFSKRKTVLRIVALLSLLTFVFSIIDIYFNTNLSNYAMPVLLLVSIGYTIIRMIIAIVHKTPGSIILGFGILFCTAFVFSLLLTVIFNGTINLKGPFIIFFILALFSIPVSISSFLAWRSAATNRNLSKQLATVENLSQEKQSILENQKEELEKEVTIRTHEVMQQKKEIEEEKKKSDTLLLNILPQEIAEELKQKGASKAQQYAEVSVLFTDFVNFTQISEQLGVDELVNELNINFTAFDQIMEKYGLEKIKTIGDAYLAVSGLPLVNAQHAQNAVLAALDILDFVSERKQKAPYGLDIRIGINSGALIAGIIGVKKFAYDIWGDTVNIAARMEQNSLPGKVNISAHTFALVKDNFNCTARGKIQAKGKGEMEMYFVNAPNPKI
ncbi:hypothetical protein DBR32_11300 [Taibaiella sp. KBW10]|uniref:adenylate/guanylate cyclase domain-containing protein n=1 Tax=Taibaiella sp. KBW10 TaxID=2153357 RepID=UPI000F5A2BF8|nr:adenylate/guanylate cyclase domain-containing protein [Taibaiella sp. KBW10]RQO30163.1 hypothetical protein DBR32_11300 [Taibaiella sp. KBW10]